jgi:uncharacterized protein YfaP (DUF2135 family)
LLKGQLKTNIMMKKVLYKTKSVQLMLLLLCMVSQSVFADVEPNDAIATATPLALATEVSGTLGIDPVSDANDYYSIVLPDDGTITLTATYDSGLGGFVYFYRPNGAFINFSAISGNTVELSVDCIGAGTIYVRAFRNSGAGGYSLEVNQTPATLSVDAEPNNTQATVLETFAVNEEFVGHIGYTDSNGAADPEDWFDVVMPEDGSYTLTMNFVGSFTGFMYLYESDGTQIINTAVSEGDEELTIDCRAADTFSVRIFRSGGCGSYTGSMSFETTFYPGEIEPNNTQSSVQETFNVDEVFTGRIGYINVTDGTDGEDWFDVVMPEDGSYTLTMNFVGSFTGFMYLYESDGTQIINTAVSEGDEEFTIDCRAADTFSVRILRSGGCGSYTGSMSFETTFYPGEIEPNNTQASVQETFDADEVFTGRIGYINVTDGTDGEDWFDVVMPEDGSYTLTMNFVGSFTGFMYLYESDGTQIINTAVSEGDEEFTIDCRAADTFSVRILRSGGCGSYTGSMSFETTVFSGDLEPNNTQPTVLESESFNSGEDFTGRIGYINVTDGTDTEDWFKIVLPNDGTVTFNLDFVGTGTGFFYLYEKDGTQLVNSSFAEGSQFITASCVAADTLYARVFRSGSCGSYKGNVSVPPLIYSDDVEPNGSLETAIISENGTVNEGHLGYVDADTGTDNEDWYQLEVVEVPFDFQADFNVAGAMSGFFYLYNGGGSQLTNSIYGQGENTLNFEITEAGTYYVRLLRQAGCAQYTLGDFCGSEPVVVINETDQTVCPGDEAIFTTAAGLSEYQWIHNGSVVGTESSLTTADAGTYFVLGFDANGCVGISEEVSLFNFTVPELSANADGPVTVCEGEAVTINASTGFASYLWNTGQTTQSIEVTADGDYSVTATTSDGCSSLSNVVTVDVRDIPSLSIIADGDIEFCLGDFVTLNANDAFESYLWNTGDAGPSLIVEGTGTYFVTGTTIDGCEAISNSIFVTVFNDEGPCVIDCAGVAGGSSTTDECGVCDDNPDNDNETCTDCAGVINGEAFLDNCGECVGGNTGEEPCTEDCFGIPGGTGVVDDCDVCREADDPDFNSTCTDCAGVVNGEAFIDNCEECVGGSTGLEACVEDCAGVFGGESITDECGVCRLPDDPDFNSTCADCAGVPNGNSTEDECGVCDDIAENDNETCADCEGIPNGSAEPGTACDADGQAGTYDESCNCVPDVLGCDYVYFLASANDIGGSDIYSFMAADDADEANLNLIASLDVEVSLAYDEVSGLLYMVHRNDAAYQTLDMNATEVVPSEVIETQYSVSGFTGASFNDGSLYAASELMNRVYTYHPQVGMGVAVSGANIGDGDIAFGENGMLYLVSSGPNRAFEVIIDGQNINLGFVPEGSSGLALRGDGDFFLSVDGRSRLIVGDANANDTGQRVQLLLEGENFFVLQGDMASGCMPLNPLGIWTETTTEMEGDLHLKIAPNPTEGTSYAVFTTSKDAAATLEVYDMTGRRVAMLFNGVMEADVEYRTEFDGSGLPNGVYLYRYTCGAQVEIEKLIIAR